MFLIIERLGLAKLLAKLPLILQRVYLILAVLFGWVLFQAQNFDHALAYLKAMLSFKSGEIFDIGLINYLALGLGIIIALGNFKTFRPSISIIATVNSRCYLLNAALLFFSIIILYFGTNNPFIYFNF